MKLRINETYNASNSFVSLDNPDNVASNWIGNKMVGNVSLNDYMRYEKGQDAKIEYMSPTEYLDRCVKDIFHGSWNKDIVPIKKYNAETITKYANAMMNGDKFPIPYLDYTTENQEGRHRALAVIEAFGEDSVMPVLVIKPTNPTEEEIRKYAEKRWPNDPEWGTNYVKAKYDKFYEESELEDNEEFNDDEFVIDEEELEDAVANNYEQELLAYINGKYNKNYKDISEIENIDMLTKAINNV